MAAIRIQPAKVRKPTWTNARVEWADGTVRQGFLRAGDAGDFTVSAASEVAFRLALDKGRPGAYTPGALFGPGLAVDAGGTFVVPG